MYISVLIFPTIPPYTELSSHA